MGILLLVGLEKNPKNPKPNRKNPDPKPKFPKFSVWDSSFKEWSAYGAGVPLILNDSDSVVHCPAFKYTAALRNWQLRQGIDFTPYFWLNSIYHLFCSLEEFRYSSSWQPDEDSDSDFRDSSSDGSCDYETDRLKYLSEQRNHQILTSEIPRRIERLSLRDPHLPPHKDCSSDEGESINSQGSLLFEYFERDLPYCREPLADKILHFPELKTLRSCDLLSSSWISVAWYPIYRIPIGPTLKDLDACFLTYHSLFTPVRDVFIPPHNGVANLQLSQVHYPPLNGRPKGIYWAIWAFVNHYSLSCHTT
ncbi:hypothetical protein D8674_033972 [Pyrus ussuriensis x Pyrus communis]|uniref:Uncharacterized protein n=1 Tax=Pyrus ussuriensis x Pyrus communis TaxID=2448454 RepID=A0A5N5HQQ8_9ROSA|nr:hypothetical protein D8674_033972 [Pyrus ussuriensis x Pyrus communis]